MLDYSIDHAHRQAEALERDAKSVDDRLASLGLPEAWINRRRGLGELRNPYGSKYANLTVRSILEQRDRGLASWLAQREGQTISGVDYEAQQQAERQAASAASLQAKTAALREQNLANRQRQQREQTHGRWSATGRWV